MGDLAAFVALVGLVAAAGIGLGMLAARRLGAWDDRRAAADAAAAGASEPAPDDGLPEDGGETIG